MVQMLISLWGHAITCWCADSFFFWLFSYIHFVTVVPLSPRYNHQFKVMHDHSQAMDETKNQKKEPSADQKIVVRLHELGAIKPDDMFPFFCS